MQYILSCTHTHTLCAANGVPLLLHTVLIDVFVFVCVCAPRLRDLSAQDKVEHQRVVKDLEKAHSDLKQAQESKDKLQTELKVSWAAFFLAIPQARDNGMQQ